MSVAPILSTSTTAPTGAEAGRLALPDLLVLIIIQLLILWAESLAASLRERTDATGLTDLTRTFGTTDVALILERITVGLQRLHALEAKILGRATDSDPERNPTVTASTRRSPTALRLPDLDPASAHPAKPGRPTAPAVRSTGPPRPPAPSAKPQRGLSILSHREAWQAPSCRFLFPQRFREAA